MKTCDKCGEPMELRGTSGIVLDVYPELHPFVWVCKNGHEIYDHLTLEEADELTNDAS